MRVAMKLAHSPAVKPVPDARLGYRVLASATRARSARLLAANRKMTATMPSNWPALLPSIPNFCLPLNIAASSASGILNLIHARATLVRARTMIVNVVQGLVKKRTAVVSPICSTELFEGTREKLRHSGVPERYRCRC